MAEYKVYVTQENQRTTIGTAVDMIRRGLAAGMVVVSLGREKRNKDQNAKMWPMLQDISSQVVWYGEKLTKEEWKDVLTAGLTKQKAVPGIDGGFVMIGVSTRNKSKAWFSELIELIYCFGANHDVVWSEQSTKVYQDYREAA